MTDGDNSNRDSFMTAMEDAVRADTDIELDTSDLSLDALPIALNKLGVSRAEYQELLLCADLQLHAVRIPRISKEYWDYLLKLARIVLKAASPDKNERSVH